MTDARLKARESPTRSKGRVGVAMSPPSSMKGSSLAGGDPLRKRNSPISPGSEGLVLALASGLA
jgi:hypothetical protein